jgi:hypothetical protein
MALILKLLLHYRPCARRSAAVKNPLSDLCLIHCERSSSLPRTPLWKASDIGTAHGYPRTCPPCRRLLEGHRRARQRPLRMSHSRELQCCFQSRPVSRIATTSHRNARLHHLCLPECRRRMVATAARRRACACPASATMQRRVGRPARR